MHWFIFYLSTVADSYLPYSLHDLQNLELCLLPAKCLFNEWINVCRVDIPGTTRSGDWEKEAAMETKNIWKQRFFSRGVAARALLATWREILGNVRKELPSQPAETKEEGIQRLGSKQWWVRDKRSIPKVMSCGQVYREVMGDMEAEHFQRLPLKCDK